MSALPDIDLSAIAADQRDAVAALLRENGALKGETASLKEIVKRLEHLVAELNHVVHGKKSEKLSEDDRQLAFEDLETAVAEVEKRQDSQTTSNDAPRRKTSAAKRNRGNLPETLPRIEQVVEPDTLACPCGCGVAIVARSCHRSRYRSERRWRRRNNDDCTRSVRTAPSGWTSCPRNCACSSPCAPNMPAAPVPMASLRHLRRPR